MCETECESGWKYSYGVCGGCIIKHNEAIQKTRLVVIAEVNAASVSQRPGWRSRGEGRRAVWCCLWAQGAGGGQGRSPATRL